MGRLGFPELLMILVIALLLFGPGKLPEIGKSLGQAVREFKKAMEDKDDNNKEPEKDSTKNT
jgi:sec-independent protein translocase protein TatA